MTGIYDFGDELNSGEITFEELIASYKELCLKSEEACQLGEEQKRVIAQLQAKKE